MTPEELRSFLTQRQVTYEERPVAYGTQFRCAAGEIVTVYNTGKVVVQGRSTGLATAVQGWAESGSPVPEAVEEVVADRPPATPSVGPERRVFIVHGHDTGARDALELLLRRMGLEPIILQRLPAGGDTIIEKLEQYLGEYGNVGFACVLLTPDDEGHRAGVSEESKYRARQNVILELGMVLARLGRRRVAILIKDSVEQPSDIAGLIYIPYKERVDEIVNELFQGLRAAGYSPRPEAL